MWFQLFLMLRHLSFLSDSQHTYLKCIFCCWGNPVSFFFSNVIWINPTVTQKPFHSEAMRNWLTNKYLFLLPSKGRGKMNLSAYVWMFSILFHTLNYSGSEMLRSISDLSRLLSSSWLCTWLWLFVISMWMGQNAVSLEKEIKDVFQHYFSEQLCHLFRMPWAGRI